MLFFGLSTRRPSLNAPYTNIIKTKFYYRQILFPSYARHSLVERSTFSRYVCLFILMEQAEKVPCTLNKCRTTAMRWQGTVLRMWRHTQAPKKHVKWHTLTWCWMQTTAPTISYRFLNMCVCVYSERPNCTLDLKIENENEKSTMWKW